MNDAQGQLANSLAMANLRKSSYIVTEQELKPANIHQQLLADYPVRYIGTQQILDHYFDDDQHNLLKLGYSCCLREAAGKLVICLIPIDALCMANPKAEALIQSIPADEFFCELDPFCLPDGEVKFQLVNLKGRTIFPPRFRARTFRRHYQINFGGAVQYATLDVVDVCHHYRTELKNSALRYTELTIHSSPDRTQDAELFGAALAEQFHLSHSASNLHRRALHHEGSLMTHYTKKKKFKSTPGDIEAQIFSAHLLENLSTIEYWKDVALEGIDIEGVHQMRVNIRRIRSALKLFKPLLADTDEQFWQAEFRWLGKRLGNVRDADVFMEWLQNHKDDAVESDKDHYLTYKADVNKLRNQARITLVHCIKSARYTSLIDGFRQWLETGQCFKDKGGINYSDASDLAEKLLRRCIRKTRKSVSAIQHHSPAESLHQVRIQSKRLRYAIDMLAQHSTHSYKAAKTVCKELQSELGEHQDACDSSARIRAYGHSHAAGQHGQEYVFFLGRLCAAQEQRIDQYRQSFFAVQNHAEKKLAEY